MRRQFCCRAECWRGQFGWLGAIARENFSFSERELEGMILHALVFFGVALIAVALLSVAAIIFILWLELMAKVVGWILWRVGRVI